MSATDVVHVMLTVLFAASAVYALRQAVLRRSPGWRDRGDQLLHTVMASAMAVMPWHGLGEVPARGQVVFFAAAAVWFPLTAVLGRRGPVSAGLVRSSPYAVGMLAMAWMPVRHGSVADMRTADLVTGALTLCLLAYALRSLTRDMPRLLGTSADAGISADIGGACDRFWHGSTAMGTAIVLLMHH
ncbi:DUF5134 domain-containing protein [Streptomyces sp. MBT62]|uniref:DUF5134 domain-containing protein n=1 Tax=Streptomyces sp. MBT62 TaxID=2800410 RepID=UPI00190AFFCD|nr:DUF5134 domain-containing protein [Streptomyces sp. MBT62]MBK3567244.1 DUF5134 domain-containing protein [Streptomyces sp. MBT62]